MNFTHSEAAMRLIYENLRDLKLEDKAGKVPDERAIRALTPHEIEELYAWLEQHCPPPIDPRIQSDLTAGRLDIAIQRALDDEKSGRTQPMIS
jgi:hypothetical protein